jgi:MinD superfamily P-loop ATPase
VTGRAGDAIPGGRRPWAGPDTCRKVADTPAHMRIAIASGKGGTGKTTLSVNFAALLADDGLDVRLLDADVEEPDCHLFLHPEDEAVDPVDVLVPVVDDRGCTACRTCAEVCAYKAITVIGTSVLVFPELCHSCGACTLFCPETALHEKCRTIGEVRSGAIRRPGNASFTLITGILAVGEAKAVPVTKATLHGASGGDVMIVDAPPGTSCPVIESVRGSDLVVLVTEPTPFGLNDLRLAVEMVRALGLRAVVAVNRARPGDDLMRDYCEQERLEIVLELPDDRRIAKSCARGGLLVDALPDVREALAAAWERIFAAATREGVMS